MQPGHWTHNFLGIMFELCIVCEPQHTRSRKMLISCSCPGQKPGNARNTSTLIIMGFASCQFWRTLCSCLCLVVSCQQHLWDISIFTTCTDTWCFGARNLAHVSLIIEDNVVRRFGYRSVNIVPVSDWPPNFVFVQLKCFVFFSRHDLLLM